MHNEAVQLLLLGIIRKCLIYYRKKSVASGALTPGPTAHRLGPGFPLVPLTFGSTAGAIWSGGPGALFPPVLLPVGVGRWGRLQLGAGTEHLSRATGWGGGEVEKCGRRGGRGGGCTLKSAGPPGRASLTPSVPGSGRPGRWPQPRWRRGEGQRVQESGRAGCRRGGDVGSAAWRGGRRPGELAGS